MNLAIYGSILLNVIILIIVAYLYLASRQQTQKKPENPTQAQLERMETSLVQIEFLENQFKQLLEELISKNKEMIQKTSANLVSYYQDTVTTMTLNYNQNTEKLMQLLDEELKHRVEKLDKASIEQIEESKKEVNAQIKKDLDKLNQELKKYGDEKFKQIDDKIYEIVSETAKNSVGKVINLTDHQELVMTALEQAKKDKFFS